MRKRPYVLAGFIVLLGVLACLGWLYIGQSDDAPGAGMIGFAALFSSLFVAFRVVRKAGSVTRSSPSG